MAKLDRYIQLASLKAYVLVATVLTALFSLFEFVEQLALVGQGHYRTVDALAYVLLTAPYRLLEVMPISMLLGSLLALSALRRTAELTAVRSLGVSESRITRSVVRLTAPVVVVLFLLAEFVIPPAQRLAQDERSSALSSYGPEDSFWANDGNQYLSVEKFEELRPKNIDIYSFGKRGALESVLHADDATIMAGGTWLLTGVVKKTVVASQFETAYFSSLPWHSFISLKQIRFLLLPIKAMPPVELFRYVRNQERQQRARLRFEQELWAKLCLPLSIASMIMAATPFVFGSNRDQVAGRRLATGAAIGIVFSFGEQIVRHVGLLLDLNPVVTAAAPPLILMAISTYLSHRNRG